MSTVTTGGSESIFDEWLQQFCYCKGECVNEWLTTVGWTKGGATRLNTSSTEVPSLLAADTDPGVGRMKGSLVESAPNTPAGAEQNPNSLSGASRPRTVRDAADHRRGGFWGFKYK